jgi:hypothetical protein
MFLLRRRYSTNPIEYRKKRLESLKGKELYPNIQKADSNDSIATIRGRITSIRTAGKRLVFIDIKNEQESCQIIMNNKYAELEAIRDLVKHAQVGDIYQFRGTLGLSLKGQESLFATESKLLAPCLRAIPLELKDAVFRIHLEHQSKKSCAEQSGESRVCIQAEDTLVALSDSAYLFAFKEFHRSRDTHLVDKSGWCECDTFCYPAGYMEAAFVLANRS